MISNGVEISIARVVKEMVRAYLLLEIVLYFLYQVFIVTVKEHACSASYGVNKTLISKTKKQAKIIKPSPNCVEYSTCCQLTAHKEQDHQGKSR